MCMPLRVKSSEVGRGWRLPNLLYANDLVLCGELKENLRVMIECFVNIGKKNGLNVNAYKIKVLLKWEEGLVPVLACFKV